MLLTLPTPHGDFLPRFPSTYARRSLEPFRPRAFSHRSPRHTPPWQNEPDTIGLGPCHPSEGVKDRLGSSCKWILTRLREWLRPQHDPRVSLFPFEGGAAQNSSAPLMRRTPMPKICCYDQPTFRSRASGEFPKVIRHETANCLLGRASLSRCLAAGLWPPQCSISPAHGAAHSSWTRKYSQKTLPDFPRAGMLICFSRPAP